MPATITNKVFFGLISLILAFYFVLISNLVFLNTYKTIAAFLDTHNQIFNNHNNISLANSQWFRNGQTSTQAYVLRSKNVQTRARAYVLRSENVQTSTQAFVLNSENVKTRALAYILSFLTSKYNKN